MGHECAGCRDGLVTPGSAVGSGGGRFCGTGFVGFGGEIPTDFFCMARETLFLDREIRIRYVRLGKGIPPGKEVAREDTVQNVSVFLDHFCRADMLNFPSLFGF